MDKNFPVSREVKYGQFWENLASTRQGWGIRHVTFVDGGKVAHSNPVRQCLYTYADTLEGGKDKATAAAAALKAIRPSIVRCILLFSNIII